MNIFGVTKNIALGFLLLTSAVSARAGSAARDYMEKIKQIEMRVLDEEIARLQTEGIAMRAVTEHEERRNLEIDAQVKWANRHAKPGEYYVNYSRQCVNICEQGWMAALRREAQAYPEDGVVQRLYREAQAECSGKPSVSAGPSEAKDSNSKVSQLEANLRELKQKLQQTTDKAK